MCSLDSSPEMSNAWGNINKVSFISKLRTRALVSRQSIRSTKNMSGLSTRTKTVIKETDCGFLPLARVGATCADVVAVGLLG